MNKNLTLSFRTVDELVKKGVSDDALVTYIALKSLYNTNMEEILISYDSINYQLYKDIIKNDGHSSQKKAIYLNSIKELQSVNKVSIIKEFADGVLLDMDGLFCTDEETIEVNDANPFDVNVKGEEKVKNYYFTIDIEQVQNVLRQMNNKKKIFRYLFMYLGLKAKNNDLLYFMCTREELVNITKIDIRSIDKYNKVLSENNIIYVKKNVDYKWSDTKNTVSNGYGLYKDKNEIDSSYGKYIKERVDNGKIILSKSYTKDYKENIKQQHEDVVKHEDNVAKKSFGRRASKMIDDAGSVPKSTEQSVNKFTGSNNVPKDTVVQDKWWIAIIKNKDNDIETRRNLACKFNCMELLEDEIPMVKKQKHEMLTFD
jgi:hypothetical protein